MFVQIVGFVKTGEVISVSLKVTISLHVHGFLKIKRLPFRKKFRLALPF